MNIVLSIQTPSLQHHKHHAIQSLARVLANATHLLTSERCLWRICILFAQLFYSKYFAYHLNFDAYYRRTTLKSSASTLEKISQKLMLNFSTLMFRGLILFSYLKTHQDLYFVKCTSLSFDPCLWFDLLCPVSIMACNCETRPPR